MSGQIILAPDSFKGSLTAEAACAAMARGIRRVLPRVPLRAVPLGDGGEGTLDALLAAAGGEVRRFRVAGPLGAPVEARLGLLSGGDAGRPVGFVEMAEASGLLLLPPGERDPLRTHTRGTGELIRRALDLGRRRILVGLGGSATVDGGLGALEALGARFLDRDGRRLPPGGGSLRRLEAIDLDGLDPRLADCELVVAADVDNPLTGPTGAVPVFAPQKGADAPAVDILAEGLRRLGEIIARQLGHDVASVPGGGAAGGLGAGLHALAGAAIRPGIEVVLEALEFDGRLRGAALVITGEGAVDGQTLGGKTVAGVARAARRLGVPVVAIGGSIAPDARSLLEQGVTALVPAVPGPVALEESLARAEEYVAAAAEMVARLLSLGSHKSGGR